MKWGTRYGPQYVNRLHAAVRRHTSGDVRFVCLTDRADGLDAGIEALPLPPINLPERVSWLPWRKLSVWQAPLFDLEGDVLFFDIDLVVIGDLNPFFDYKPGAFCVIENWTQKGQGIGNTSVFRLNIGQHTHVYERFRKDPEAILAAYRIEQQFISAEVPEQEFWPDGWCVSFKHDLVPRFPANWLRAPEPTAEAKVVAFTGLPDPDQAAEGRWPAPWYKKFYKHTKPAPWIAEHWR